MERRNLTRNLNVLRGELKNPEYNGSSKFNTQVEFPIEEGKSVKVSINVETNATSSVAMVEKLQENAERSKDLILSGLGEAFDLFMEKAKIFQEYNKQLEEEERKNRKSYDWDSKMDLLLVLLKKNNKPEVKDFLEEVQSYKHSYSDEGEELYDYDDIKIAKWTLAQVERAKLGWLSEAEVEDLKRLYIL